MSERYNGWKNYETWVVNLWIDNDEGADLYWRQAADEALADAGDRDDAEYALAQRLQEEHEAARPDEGASVYTDLLNAALGEVDWREVAEHMIAAAVERAGEDEDEAGAQT